jgi:polyphosphate:AMP phosphotransferase
MINNLDLSMKLSKDDYKMQKEALQEKISELQREIKEKGIPVLIVFEGWGASGKGTLINELIQPLDPRGFTVYTTNTLNEDERLRPFLWRYWIKTPSRGRIAIFDKSWYRRVHVDRMDSGIHGEELRASFQDIKSFEQQLSEDGCVIIKFFLHISKKEQKERFKKLEGNESTSWRVTDSDWKHNEQYEDYIKIVEEMINETHREHAPWVAVESEDKRYAAIKIFKHVIERMEEALRKANTQIEIEDTSSDKKEKEKDKIIILDKIDLSKTLDKEQYKKKIKEYQKEIRFLEHEAYRKRLPVIILYEGWDAAGKGGNIKRLTEEMDPRGYEVIPVAAPSYIEKSHHYLWRFWKEVPKAGHIAIFDRSWYGRVMVERIEGFCSENEWKRAYREINEMESQLTNFGTAVIKFWMHIDKAEQLRRFEERKIDPRKQWKITDEDWRNRDKWDQYEEAVNEMLVKTDTYYAPWHIIESNDKYYARIKVLETVIEVLKNKLK